MGKQIPSIALPLLLYLTWLSFASASVPCYNGGELSADGNTCYCFDGFRGPDCNMLFDFCDDEDNYNSQCAPDSCVPIFSAFFCSRCKNESMQGVHCVRQADDPTPTIASPYFVFRPKVALFEDLPILVSLKDLGENLTVKVVWGDGVVDIRKGTDFFIGNLQNEVSAIGLDAFAPGTPAHNALPPGRRYMILLKHVFNKRLSSKGTVKNWLIFINNPTGPRGLEMKHEFPVRVVMPPSQDRGVELSMPELGGSFTAETVMPHWSRRDSIQVLGEAQDTLSLGHIDEYTFSFALIVRIGMASQSELPSVVAPNKRFSAAPFTLPMGKHGLKYSAWNGTRLVEFIVGYFHIVVAPLQVVMLGGSSRIVSPRWPLILDANGSRDLNEKDLRHVAFTWRCSGADQNTCPFRNTTSMTVTIPPSSLRDGQQFLVELEAARPDLEATIVSQSVTVDAMLTVNVAIVCERNCAAGLGTLHTEPVSLRAECSAPCPRLFWSLGVVIDSVTEDHPSRQEQDDQPVLPVGSQGRRFIIAPPSLTFHTKYQVNLSVAVVGDWIVSSSHVLFIIPQPNHTCSALGSGVRTTIKCEDNTERQSLWSAFSLYKFFQRPVTGGRVLIGYTFSGIGVALVFLPQPVEVVATMPWGSEWTVSLETTGGRPMNLNLSTTIQKAVHRYQKGNDMVATVMLSSVLSIVLESGETPAQADLVYVAALCHQYMGDKPHPALWWQYAQMTLMLGDLGVREASTFLDDLAERMGRLLVKVSAQLIQLAKDREPPAISTADVDDHFRKITKVVTHMTVDAESDTARKIRNLTVREDELEPDYLLYTDLMPGHVERERKFRSAARGAVKTLTNLIRAMQWRMLPGMPPYSVDIDSRTTAPGLGRITVWSQVESMGAMAERPENQTPLPDNCDFHVDREKANEMDMTSEAFAMTVAFIDGSLSWFEPVPPTLVSNTPTVAMVDLQLYQDGPAGAVRPVPEAVSVTLPTPANLASTEGAGPRRIHGQLRALTNGSQWTDHVVVYNLHAFDGTGVVQVTFPTTEDVGDSDAQPEMVVVLRDKWPKPADFLSHQAVVLSPRRREDVSIAFPVRARLNAFIHLGLAFSNGTLEAAAATGFSEVKLNYSFLPLNLACKSWSDKRYKWITGQHKEIWQLSGPRQLSCGLHHLSLFAGLVVIPPHYVHPLRDAKLFTTLYRNWLVFAFVMSNLAIYLVWLFFARRHDRMEENEWRVVVLDDITPEADYPYLVSVFSGNLAQGQTTAYVGIRICGDKQDSGAHMLSHERRRLSHSYDDWFLLYTVGPLGDLLSLELWSDCGGLRPYWYCEKVLVEELSTGRVWTFPGYCWLSLEHGTRRACATLRPGPLHWKHRFNSLFKASARGDHTWTSVLFRHPRMNFTRSQRLTTAFTEHFLNMLISIMFFQVAADIDIEGEPDNDALQTMLGRAFIVALESCCITLPAVMIINWIFQVEEVEASDSVRGRRSPGSPSYATASGPPGRSPTALSTTPSLASAFSTRDVDVEAALRRPLLVARSFSGTERASTATVLSPVASSGLGRSTTNLDGDLLSPPSPLEESEVSTVPVDTRAWVPDGLDVAGQCPPRHQGPVQGPATAMAEEEAKEARTILDKLGVESTRKQRQRKLCSGYRRLRVRTIPRSSGLPTVMVYVGGWTNPDQDDSQLPQLHSRDSFRVAAAEDISSKNVSQAPAKTEARAPAEMEREELSSPLAFVREEEAGLEPETLEGETRRKGCEVVVLGVTEERLSGVVGESPPPPEEPRAPLVTVAEGQIEVQKQTESADAERQKTEKRKKRRRKKRKLIKKVNKEPPRSAKGRPWWSIRQKWSWRILAGWILCPLTILICSYFTILYGLKYGWQRSYQWLMAMVTSLALSIFILQPIKIIIIALVFAKFLQKDAALEQKTAPFARPVTLPPLVPPKYRTPGTTAKMYRKLTRTEAEVLLVLRKHRQQLTKRTWDTVLWVVWIGCIYACVTAASDQLFFFLQEHVSGMVLSATHTRTRQFGQFHNVLTYGEFYEYLNKTMVQSLLHRRAPYNETPDVLHPALAYAADNVTRMIGVIRLRQQRMQRESECEVAEPFRWLDLPCYPDYYKVYSDTVDYGPGWNASVGNASIEDQSLGKHALSIWRYRPAWELDTLFSIGQDTQFLSGGYVADLGRVLYNAEIEVSYLSSHGWLDRRTRGVFIEFVLYSPPTNIFCDVLLLLERSPASSFHFSSKLYAYRLGYTSGKWSAGHTGALVLLIAVSFIIFVREAIALVRLGWAYPFNWFDVILVGVIVINAGLYFAINGLLNTLLKRMTLLDPKIFISFEVTTFLNSSMQFGLGLLVVLATVRCWRVLSFATHFQVVKTMLRLAYWPLLQLLGYLMVVQFQFSVLFNLIMGSSQENLHALTDAYVLLLAYLVDYTADYDEFSDSRMDTQLTLISYWVFVAFMYFFFLNFFLGIVSMAFETAGDLVRQKEIEGFSMANLICDELRFWLKLPGGRLRRDSSLFRHIRKNFIHQKSRIHGETLRVARAELGAMNMMYKLFTEQSVSERELQGTMTMIALAVATPMEERVRFPGPSVQMSIGKSWNGEELLDMHKLHTVMETLNQRSVDRDLAIDADQIAALRRLLKEVMGETPPSTLPVVVRVRRGAAFQRRPTFRLANLLIRRRKCVQVRFRLRRISAPQSKPSQAKSKPPWRP